MAHKVILPPQKNYIPQFLKQRDINSYYPLWKTGVHRTGYWGLLHHQMSYTVHQLIQLVEELFPRVGAGLSHISNTCDEVVNQSYFYRKIQFLSKRGSYFGHFARHIFLRWLWLRHIQIIQLGILRKKTFLRKKTLYLVVKNQLLEGGQVAVLSIGKAPHHSIPTHRGTTAL